MIEIIRTILGEWKGRELPEVIERSVDLVDYSHIEPGKIIVITGFRRTGKTYLAYPLIKRLFCGYSIFKRIVGKIHKKQRQAVGESRFYGVKKETKALLKASKELKCNNLVVITEDYDAFEEINGKRIVYIPLWRWILQNDYMKNTSL